MGKRRSYDKQTVIAKLKKIKGVNLKFQDNELSFIEVSHDATIGIKMLGQMDFLSVPIHREVKREQN